MSLIESVKVPNGEFRVYSQRPDVALTQVKQVHGKTIVRWNSTINDQLKDYEADGIFVHHKEKGQNLCIITADCLPIYIYGTKGLAMLHAGWKSLHQKIILQQEIRDLAPSYAYIGPHICQQHYQVSEEFQAYFPDSGCLEADIDSPGKLKFSLLKEASHQLKQLSTNIEIQSSNLCTFESTHLHSYRKDSTMSRNWNLFIYRD